MKEVVHDVAGDRAVRLEERPDKVQIVHTALAIESGDAFVDRANLGSRRVGRRAARKDAEQQDASGRGPATNIQPSVRTCRERLCGALRAERVMVASKPMPAAASSSKKRISGDLTLL